MPEVVLKPASVPDASSQHPVYKQLTEAGSGFWDTIETGGTGKLVRPYVVVRRALPLHTV